MTSQTMWMVRVKMHLNLSCYQLQTGCYILCKSHGIHKAKPMVDKRERNLSKHMTTENCQITKREKGARKEERNKGITKQPENNEQNGSKSLSINNYFKYNYKFSDQKTEWIKPKIHLYAACKRFTQL